MLLTDQFPNLRYAVVQLLLAMGAINRNEGEHDMLIEACDILSRTSLDHRDFTALDTWLGSLTPAQIETLVDGEADEAALIFVTSPDNHVGYKLAGVFDTLFEEL